MIEPLEIPPASFTCFFLLLQASPGMKSIQAILWPGLLLTLAGGAFAQGTDCSNAVAISGLGTTSFDTTGYPESDYELGANCSLTIGTTYLSADGFFQWTATAAGDYIFDTNGSVFDTQLALYSGSGCTATCIEVDDDDGVGLDSLISLPGVTAGQQILIQIGGYNGANGSGVLNIGLDPCSVGTDDSFEQNDTCAAPSAMAAGIHPGLFVSDSDPDFYSFAIPANMILDFNHTVTTSGFLDFGLYDASCSFLGTQFGDFTYMGGPTGTTLIVEVIRTSTGATCDTYDLDVFYTPDPCAGTADDSFEDNEDCATAAPIADGTYNGLYVTKTDDDNYLTCVDDGATITVDILFLDDVADVDLFLWDINDTNCGGGIVPTSELDSSTSVSDNEQVSWTNTTGAQVQVVIQVDVWPSSSGDCNDYDMIITGSTACGNVGVGTPFCDPMDINSTGLPTTLTGNFTAPSGSGLHLESAQGPPGEFGYFLIGTGVSDPGIVISNGRLCLAVTGGNQFGRYNATGTLNSVGQYDAAGIMQNFVGTSSVGSGFDVPLTVPITGSPQIMAGESWHFQLWHREAGGASNFSNGLTVTF